MNYAVILAGGRGSRFWPLSRESFPKQFLNIPGKESFFTAALRRIQPFIPAKNIFVVTNSAYLNEIKRQSRKFGVADENIILEPKPLNTLPAIALCAQLIGLRDKQANLLVLPSDHYVKDNAEFKKTAFSALRLSLKGFIALIGIKPADPCAGYGYFKAGKKLTQDAFVVESFTEKPSSEKAKKLFRKRGIFWNAGIFCFQAGVILSEIKAHLPKLYAQISRIKRKQDIRAAWAKIKPVSIDYGLLEKSRRLAMVKAGFDWHDLGSWDALYEILPKDRRGNILLSGHLGLDTAGTLIYSLIPKRFIATVGLKDTIIVDTDDALLVCKIGRSQEIKKLVELLKKKRKKCV